jgi:ELWxxDGT repeat protein
VASWLLAPSAATAQEPRQLLDFPPRPASTTFYPTAPETLATASRALLWPATDGEPWSTDGTVAGTVPLVEFTGGFQPIASHPDFVLFLESSWVWASDGTLAGSRPLLELDRIDRLGRGVALGDRVLFPAETVDGAGIWETDGTPGGTRLAVADEAFVHGRREPVALGDRMVFVVPAAGVGLVLAVTDGTPSGSQVFDRSAGSVGAPEVISWWPETADGSTVYFLGETRDGGQEVWRTDGTLAGTWAVTDLSDRDGEIEVLHGPLRDARGRLFALLGPADQPGALWLLGDRLEGSARLSDLSEHLVRITDFGSTFGITGDRVVVEADDRLFGHDGTPGAPAVVLGRRIPPGPMALVGEREVRLQPDEQPGPGAHRAVATPRGVPILVRVGSDLWATDGTPEGTRRYDDDCAECAGESLNLFRLAPDGTPLGTIRGEVYRLGAGGPIRLTDLSAKSGAVNAWLGSLGDGAFFHVQTPDQGEIWITDGTVDGTMFLTAGTPWRPDHRISEAVRWGDRVAFLADVGDGEGQALWLTDGTVAGTRVVYRISSADRLLFDLTLAGERLLFLEAGGGSETELRVLEWSGETPDGRVEVLFEDTVSLAPTRRPEVETGLERSGERVYLLADGGFRFLAPGADRFGPWIDAPWEPGEPPVRLAGMGADDLFLSRRALWSTDGTAAGTELLADLGGDLSRLAPLGSGAGFIRSINDLWATDGTVDGTRRLDELRLAPSPTASWSFREVFVLGSRWVIEATSGFDRVLWATDGTVAGTVELVRDRPVLDGAVLDGRLVFSTVDPAHGEELWSTDGTPGGTGHLVDLLAGPFDSAPEDLAALGSVVLFSAHLPAEGREPWVTDGTAAGTRPAGDLLPGPEGSLPAAVARLGDLLLLELRQGPTGLWAIDLGDLPATGPAAPPERPDRAPLTSHRLQGFRFWVEITPRGQAPVAGSAESACIAETLCVSGALDGRTEAFVRVIGPRPNGLLWPVVTRFTPSRVEVWIEQVSTGALRYYDLPAGDPETEELSGLFDRDGFVP